MSEGLAQEQVADSVGVSRREVSQEDFGRDFHGYAEAAAALAERALIGGAAPQIASEDIARVLTAAMKLYAAKREKETGTEAVPPPPVLAERVTPTEVVVLVSELMRAVNLNLFDLSMWYRRAR